MLRLPKVLIACFCLGVLLWGPGPADRAAAATAPASSCLACHDTLKELLPEKHQPTADGQECSACHKAELTDEAAAKPYSAFLHRIHAKKDAGVACLDCHVWTEKEGLGIKGSQLILGKPTEKNLGLIKDSTVSWADSDMLDAIHSRKDVTCQACHGKNMPSLGDTVESSRCLICHGPMEDLIKKTTPAEFADRNPHNSHLGEIECNVCHYAHSESKAYCLECHPKFEMTMPEAKAAQPAKDK